MVPDLVTLEEAREHLRLDSDSQGGVDDAWLALAISGVSASIANWVKEDWRLFEAEVDSAGEVVLDSQDEPVNVFDSNGDRVVLPSVRAAALMQLDYDYRFRDGTGPSVESIGAYTFVQAYGFPLCAGATARLTPLRKPTLS